MYSLPQCKGHPAVADWIEHTVAQWPGVDAATCRASTGRLRIKWNNEISQAAKESEGIENLIEHFRVREAFRRKHRSKSKTPQALTANSHWRSARLKDILNDLQVSPQTGLADEEALERIKKFGSNFIPPIPPRADSEIFLKQFQNPATALLVASAVASLIVGGVFEAGLIAAVVLLNSEIGYVTERKAERSLEKLANLGPREAFVLRKSEILQISTEDIVPGDILILSPGMTVMADARLVRARDLLVDESILTGESYPVVKTPTADRRDNSFYDNKNLLFRGSAVVSGRGHAVVIATGMNTEAGRIQGMLGQRRHKSTRLQQKLERLNSDLVKTSIGASGLLVLFGILRGQPLLPLMKTAVSLAVAAVPEGLPTISTYCLSQVVSRLLGENVLVRDLQAIETLGSIEVLCLDKTGTLTENRMQVSSIALPWMNKPTSATTILAQRNPELTTLMSCAVLCNDAARKEDGSNSGSPTEQALLEFARAFGIQSRNLRAGFTRVETNYRTSERSYMSTSHRTANGEVFKMMKGSPLEVLALSRQTKIRGRKKRLTEPLRRRIREQNDQMSAAALRVLGFAYQTPADDEWTWLGLIGLHDPPREGTKEVLARFHKAGIRTVIITGDQASTAEALAKDLGLSDGENLQVVDFSLHKKNFLAQTELQKLVANAHVFARVAPEDKRTIIELIRESGRVVAMVGDGINDAPALKAAHLGVAVGQGGAEVAKEVAGVVLLDNRLDHLLNAVAEGRTANNSLRKGVRYLTSSNLSEILIVLTQAALGLQERMSALHLLWMNMIGDTFPALALVMDKPNEAIMNEPPPQPNAPLLGRQGMKAAAADAGIFSAAVMASLGWGHAKGRTRLQNQALAMHTLIINQIFHVFSSHSREKVDWRKLMKENKPLVYASLGSLAAHLTVASVPALRRRFHLGGLPIIDSALCAGLSALSFKWIENRKSA